MKTGIACTSHPGQYLLPARLRRPVERFVAPRLQRVSDTITRVRRGGEIFHPALCHGRNNPPTETGNIRSHGRRHGDMVLASEMSREVVEMWHLFSIRQAGEHVGVERTEPDASFPYIGKYFFPLRWRRLLEVTLQSPDRFYVPLVPGILRVIRRLADELHRLLQVLPLSAFNVGLQICVSDVVVRIAQEIDRLCLDGCYLNFVGLHKLPVHLESDRDNLRRLHFGNGDLQDIRSDL